jgi:ubiquitin C-terminal hydrolase
MQVQKIEKRCESCSTSSNVTHTQYENSYATGDYLFFNLQHFEGKSIMIYEQLEMTITNISTNSDGTNKVENTNVDYHLRGVVMHKGSQNFGHYTAYLKDQDSWYLYNDDAKPLKIDENISTVLGRNMNVSKKCSYPLLWYEKMITTSTIQSDEEVIEIEEFEDA